MQGFKDTVPLTAGDPAKLAVTFPKKGMYMFRCHTLEHEDRGMMGQIKVEWATHSNSGHTVNITL